MHVPSSADLGRVQHDEQAVWVEVHPGDVVAFPAVLDRQGVTVQLVAEQAFRIFGPERDIQPGEAVGPVEQRGKVARLVHAGAITVDPAQRHAGPAGRLAPLPLAGGSWPDKMFSVGHGTSGTPGRADRVGSRGRRRRRS